MMVKMKFSELTKTSRLNEAYDRDKDFEQQIKDIGDSLKVIEKDAYRKDNYSFAFNIAIEALQLYINMTEDSNEEKVLKYKKYAFNTLKDIINQL